MACEQAGEVLLTAVGGGRVHRLGRRRPRRRRQPRLAVGRRLARAADLLRARGRAGARAVVDRRRRAADHAALRARLMRRALRAARSLALVARAGRRAGAGGVRARRRRRSPSRLPLVRSEERTHPGAFSQVSSPISGQWQVAFYSRNQEFVQVIVSAADGRVLGQYTGFQIAWTMARGYPGAFGRHLDALYIWLPLCLLFLAPFFDWRAPARMLNLDLLALTSFSISLAFFNHGDIYQSVPLSYPPLVYLLARLLWLARPGAPRPPPLRLNFGSRWLALGLVVPDRLPDRPERRRLERHRRRLRERRRRPEGARRRRRSTASSPARSDAATPTARSPTRPTRRSSRSVGLQRPLGRSAGRARRGDLLRPARDRAAVRCSAGGSAARAPASCWPTPGRRSRSPRSRSSPTPTTRSSPRWSSRRCSSPARRPRAARSRRSPGSRSSRRWRSCRCSRPTACASAERAGSSRFAVAFAITAALVAIPALAHDTLATIYYADRRLPGGPQRPVLDLGPLRRPARRADDRPAVRDRARRRARGAAAARRI